MGRIATGHGAVIRNSGAWPIVSNTPGKATEMRCETATTTDITVTATETRTAAKSSDRAILATRVPEAHFRAHAALFVTYAF